MFVCNLTASIIATADTALLIVDFIRSTIPRSAERDSDFIPQKCIIRPSQPIYSREKSSDPHLLTYGFTREHFDDFVPEALLQIVGSYHSMWIHTRFTKTQINQVVRPQHPQPIKIHIHRAVLNGETVDFLLKLEKCNDVLLVGLLIKFKPCMEYVAGRFDLAINGNCCKPQLATYPDEDTHSKWCGAQTLPVIWTSWTTIELNRSNGLMVSSFIDLTLITMKNDMNIADDHMNECPYIDSEKGESLTRIQQKGERL